MNVTFLISAYREIQYPPPDMPEIAFAGRSNVGKSSLINVLVNRKKLARTSSRPGRTQSINFFQKDNSVYLVDLPGYGYASVPVTVKKSWKNLDKILDGQLLPIISTLPPLPASPSA